MMWPVIAISSSLFVGLRRLIIVSSGEKVEKIAVPAYPGGQGNRHSSYVRFQSGVDGPAAAPDGRVSCRGFRFETLTYGGKW